MRKTRTLLFFFCAIVAGVAWGSVLVSDKPPKPCSIFMHTFEPPEGYVKAQAFSTGEDRAAVLYIYADGSGVAIFAPRVKGLTP